MHISWLFFCFLEMGREEEEGGKGFRIWLRIYDITTPDYSLLYFFVFVFSDDRFPFFQYF